MVGPLHTHIREQRRGGEEKGTDAQERADCPGFCSEACGGEGSSPPLESLPFLTWSGHPTWALSQNRGAILTTPCSPQKKSLGRRNIPELSSSRARGRGGGTKMVQRSVGMLRARAHQSRMGLRFAHAWHRLDLEDPSPGSQEVSKASVLKRKCNGCGHFLG